MGAQSFSFFYLNNKVENFHTLTNLTWLNVPQKSIYIMPSNAIVLFFHQVLTWLNRILSHGERVQVCEALAVVQNANNDEQVKQFSTGEKSKGGSVAEWLACRTRARKSTGSNRSRDAVE